MADYDEDIDGAPMDDLDGVALSGAQPFGSFMAPGAAAPPPPPAAPFADAPLAVPANKVALFDRGPAKILTPFEKRRLEAEERRSRAEDEAAAEYARFVSSFDDKHAATSGGSSHPHSHGRPGGGGRASKLLAPKMFVAGGVIGGDPAAPSEVASAAPAAAAAPSATTTPTITPSLAPTSAAAIAFKPLDPATLRATLPSISAPPKALPFLPFHAAAAESTTAAATAATAASAPAPAVVVPAPPAAPVALFSLAASEGTSDEGAAVGASVGAASSRRHMTSKPGRAIDSFLLELKQHAEDKAAGRVPHDSSVFGDRPRDTACDPTTTNLFVGNLAPDLTEKDLCAAFAVFGDIASVKIMWPRFESGSGGGGGGDRSGSTTHQGFVSFMRREDAETALREMHATTLAGCVLKLNWSRAVPLPAQPLVYKASAKDARTGRLQYGRTGHAAVAPPADVAGPSAAAEAFVLPPDALKYEVVFPSDLALKSQIDLCAVHVRKHGLAFEQALESRATTDGTFAFLTHTSSLEHLYYRWRLYSLAQGDSLDAWRTRPFQMVKGGAFWMPPDPDAWRRDETARRDARERARDKRRAEERDEEARVRRAERLVATGGRDTTDTDTGAFRDRAERGKLTDIAQKKLLDLLRAVTMERTQIRDLMGFCLDHSDASSEVVETIVDSLGIDETPVQKKIARLYVVSDILHNSSAPIPNASSYRSLFQSHLPTIFAALRRTHLALGRISGHAMKDKVSGVLRAWNQWALFPGNFIGRLEEIFEKGQTTEDR